MRAKSHIALLAGLMSACAPAAQAQDGRWSGFYIGANAGRAQISLSGTDGFLETDGVVFGITPTTFAQYPAADSRSSFGGWFGGAQASYQLQRGAWVAGIETDFQWADIDAGSQTLGSEQGPTFDTTARLEYFGTLRLRGGWAVSSALIYATGGLAYGRGVGTVMVTPGIPTDPAPGGPFPGRDSLLMLGWAVGAGVEFAFSEALSLKAEYLHLDLGDAVFRFALAGSGGSFLQQRQSLSADVARMGLNVRF